MYRLTGCITGAALFLGAGIYKARDIIATLDSLPLASEMVRIEKAAAGQSVADLCAAVASPYTFSYPEAKRAVALAFGRVTGNYSRFATPEQAAICSRALQKKLAANGRMMTASYISPDREQNIRSMNAYREVHITAMVHAIGNLRGPNL